MVFFSKKVRFLQKVMRNRLATYAARLHYLKRRWRISLDMCRFEMEETGDMNDKETAEKMKVFDNSLVDLLLELYLERCYHIHALAFCQY